MVGVVVQMPNVHALRALCAICHAVIASLPDRPPQGQQRATMPMLCAACCVLCAVCCVLGMAGGYYLRLWPSGGVDPLLGPRPDTPTPQHPNAQTRYHPPQESLTPIVR